MKNKIKIDLTCDYCKRKYNRINRFVVHLKLEHKIICFLDYLKHLNVIPKCPICGQNTKWVRGLLFREYCSKKCAYKLNSSEERKKILSESLKIAHKENRHPGWSFINKDISRRSYPETYFYNVLKNNNLFEQFTIIEKLSFGKYFLDFAIIELKLDLEIDGQN